MKEIVVISGKGGTGKTSISASFAYLERENSVIADCDVDAANMHLLLKPQAIEASDFFSGVKAKIDPALCINCGVCEEVCRFDAVFFKNATYSVKQLNCEGCGYCDKVCPTKAIAMVEQNVGKFFISKSRFGNYLIHARLAIGAENSGKLVAKVKNEAKKIAKEKGIAFVIVDGAPGIGCPVLSSLTGANYVVLVTEATIAGFHDLKRVVELVKKFRLKAGAIINKHDLNKEVTNEIRNFLEKEKIDFISKIPYNTAFTDAIVNERTIVEFNQNEISDLLKTSWEKIKFNVKEKENL
ncbi:MAG: 4Fe-4S binding protein [Ignavibacteria bacterium]|jgi:MinD superfamily P-loop ATPase|nr:4Fe-4S binding protein [Ignavibacteria bacterium]